MMMTIRMRIKFLNVCSVVVMMMVIRMTITWHGYWQMLTPANSALDKHLWPTNQFQLTPMDLIVTDRDTIVKINFEMFPKTFHNLHRIDSPRLGLIISCSLWLPPSLLPSQDHTNVDATQIQLIIWWLSNATPDVCGFCSVFGWFDGLCRDQKYLSAGRWQAPPSRPRSTS